MINLHDIHREAERVVGAVRWLDINHGTCTCPGKHLHTSKQGDNDCTVFVDGVPTITCFHSSCQSEVEAANRQLRRFVNGIDGGNWRLILPDGSTVTPGGRFKAIPSQAKIDRRQKDKFKAQLEEIACKTAQLKPGILEFYKASEGELWEDSPTRLDEETDDFRIWLNWWGHGDNIWIGEVNHTGSERHSANFNPNWQWMGLSHKPPQFTCGSSFQPDTFTRSNSQVAKRRFLVVESDVLTKSECIAVFRYYRKRYRRKLHGIVDTGGKSLHGWFTYPGSVEESQYVQALLTALDCDPAMFKASQPVRCPGAIRENGNPQRLIWARADLPAHPPLSRQFCKSAAALKTERNTLSQF